VSISILLEVSAVTLPLVYLFGEPTVVVDVIGCGNSLNVDNDS
jgi:hypothetical protein